VLDVLSSGIAKTAASELRIPVFVTADSGLS